MDFVEPFPQMVIPGGQRHTSLGNPVPLPPCPICFISTVEIPLKLPYRLPKAIKPLKKPLPILPKPLKQIFDFSLFSAIRNDIRPTTKVSASSWSAPTNKCKMNGNPNVTRDYLPWRSDRALRVIWILKIRVYLPTPMSDFRGVFPYTKSNISTNGISLHLHTRST